MGRVILSLYFHLPILVALSNFTAAVSKNMRLKTLAITLTLLFSASVQAQQEGYPFTPLSLKDLKAFRPQAGNWQIVGGVIAHPDKKLDIQVFSGTGVLVNLPDSKRQDNLFTVMEHGDIELEMEFLVPRESNSGVYFMGRYELQILDSYTRGLNKSWQPDKHDCAAIYERWDEQRPEGQKGYQGHPPRVNVSRAPGLWQHYKVIFQAPRFNQKGEKIANARFVKVFHNGVLVHENVELSGPTRAAAFETEAPRGPLMLQGDHGPVAFRNIRYRLYDKPGLKVENVTVQRYHGVFDKALPDWKTLQPISSLPSFDGITWQVSEDSEPGAWVFNGTITIKEAGTYYFSMECNGACNIFVNGGKIVEKNGENWRGDISTGKIELKAGSYPIQVSYAKWIEWQRPALGIYAEGPGIARHALHGLGSLPPPSPTPIMNVQITDGKPYPLRAFVEHNGKQYPHAISVGFPQQIHYAADLNQGKLLYLWRGGFVDATPIWHSRGGGNVPPLGSVISLRSAPLAVPLANEKTPFPDSVGIIYKGMQLDAKGVPSFTYQLGNAFFTDKLTAEDNGSAFQREITARNTMANTFVQIGKGFVEKIDENLWRINHILYLQLSPDYAQQVTQRQIGEHTELIWTIPPGGGSLRYRLIF